LQNQRGWRQASRGNRGTHDADLGRAQALALERVADLADVHDGAGLLAGDGHLEERLVEVRVKLLAHGVDGLDSVPLERFEKLGLRHLDAVKESLERNVVGRNRLGDVLKREREDVDRREEVRRKALDGLLRGLAELLGRPPLEVGKVGLRVLERVLRAGIGTKGSDRR
jgi:hypothetical protein